MKRYIKSAILPISDHDIDTRYELAYDNSVDAHILTALADDPFTSVREQVANNPNTPIEVLYQLSKDPFMSVRLAVAHNPNVPINLKNDLMRKLDSAKSVYAGKWFVRLCVYHNPSDTEEEILKYLSESISYLVGLRGYKKYSELLYDYSDIDCIYQFIIGDFSSYDAFNHMVKDIREYLKFDSDLMEDEHLLAE